MPPTGTGAGDVSAAIAAIPLWYHTMEVAPGVVTPGWFDLRPVIERMPWPDVRGKRCLDVGPWDGQLSFELERRGAAEVVAVDIGSHEDWDWPPLVRERDTFERVLEMTGRAQGRGFELACRLLDSSVQRQQVNVYDLAPDIVGRFDVVVCGSLLLHLRDPLRALQSIRSVCSGLFLSAETIDLPLTLLQRGRPSLRLDGVSDLIQWFTPSAAGHRRLLEAAGFTLEHWTRPYAIPFGPEHPPRTGTRSALVRLARQALMGSDGVPHQAVLARA